VLMPNTTGLTMPPIGHIWVLENNQWTLRPETSVPRR